MLEKIFFTNYKPFKNTLDLNIRDDLVGILEEYIAIKYADYVQADEANSELFKKDIEKADRILDYIEDGKEI